MLVIVAIISIIVVISWWLKKTVLMLVIIGLQSKKPPVTYRKTYNTLRLILSKNIMIYLYLIAHGVGLALSIPHDRLLSQVYLSL